MAARVLVVDDDATVCDVVARYLGDAGYVVDVAADGLAGLDAATRGEPDAVVLDLMLPGLSGLEVCRALRLRATPPAIVMLTALGEEQDRVLGLEFGAAASGTTPFRPARAGAAGGVGAAPRGARRVGLAGRRRAADGPRVASGVPGGAGAAADHPRVRPARPSAGASGPGVHPGRAPGPGVGLGLRRPVDRHRARAPAAGEGRGRPHPPAADRHRVGVGYRYDREPS